MSNNFKYRDTDLHGVRWKLHMRSYYNDTVKPPKQPGALAIEVGGMTREALELDISVSHKRTDIGRVVLVYPNGHEKNV